MAEEKDLNYSTLNENWIHAFIFYTTLTASVVLCIYVAFTREVDWSDEGLYLYDAWAAWGTNEFVPQSHPFMVSTGYILGLPYLFGEFGVGALRSYSLILWLLSYLYLTYSLARNLQVKRLWLYPSLSCLPLMIIPTLSYQTMPYIFFNFACGALLSFLIDDNKNKIFIASLLITLAALPYRPAIVLIPIFFSLVFLIPKFRAHISNTLLGIGLGAVLVITIYLVQTADTSYHVIPAVGSSSNIFITALHKFWLGTRYIIGFSLLGSILLGITLLIDKLIGTKEKQTFTTVIWSIVLLLAVVLSVSGQSTQQIWSDTIGHFIYPRDKIELRGFLLQYSLFCLPFFLYLLKSKTNNFINIALILLLPIFLGGLQFCVGTGHIRIYLAHIVPYLLTGSFLVYLANSRATLTTTRVFNFVFCICICLGSFYEFLNASYRGKPAHKTTLWLQDQNLGALRFSEVRAQTIEAMKKTYQQYNCDKHYFIAIDRTPLAYPLFQRAAPIGNSWAGPRLPKIIDQIKAQKSACIIYRELGESANRKDIKKHIVDYLALPDGKFTQIALGSAGIFFLYFSLDA